MELRQLRYLLAIAEERGFTQASEKVYVSQSALSQQIQLLEQEVGTTLLNRSKRGVHLTAAGEILCHHAQRILLELEQATVAIQELQGLQRGELHIGVVQTVNDYLIPSLVTTFNKIYPQIKLSVEELSSDEIETRLEDGTLQVGLGFIPSSNRNINAEPLVEEQLVLIVRSGHSIASQNVIPVRSLDGMPMVMLSNTFCTRRLWEENAQLVSAQPHIVMEMNTVSSILDIIEKTDMATVLPKFAVIVERSRNLVTIDLVEPRLSRQVGLLWHRGNYLCTTSQAFISIAKEVSKKLARTEDLIAQSKNIQ